MATKKTGSRSESPASCFTCRVRPEAVRFEHFLPLSGIRARTGLPGSRTRQRCCRRVSKNSRSRRHRLELLDGSISAFGSGSRECFASENLTRGRCRCRPRPGTRRLQRFPYALERRRPRYPHTEGSQGRVREVAMIQDCNDSRILASAVWSEDVQKIPDWMTLLPPCRTRVAVNGPEEFSAPERVPLPVMLAKSPRISGSPTSSFNFCASADRKESR